MSTLATTTHGTADDEIVEGTRRRLTGRQAETVARLVAAAVDELRRSGYAGLTVRRVAKRAGVAPATAYTYFASKDHLVAEAFWRQMRALPPVQSDQRRTPANRVAAALEPWGRLVAGNPQLAEAATSALLADDPDVKHLRDRIGMLVHQRLAAALGDDATPAVLRALDLAWAGASLHAGMGHLGYGELADAVAGVAALAFGARP